MADHPRFSHLHTFDDIENLRASLLDCFKQIELSKTRKQNVRILNLACGRSDETGILLDLLAPSPEASEFIGLDIRAREIQEADERWSDLSKGNTQFLVHDGTKLDEIKELRDGFDYAFMRHQNFYDGDLTWHTIYDRALHLLKPEGLLIITSYFDKEHLLAIKGIQSLGAKLMLSWKNPRSRMILEKFQKSADRHIAIFRLP